VTISLTFKRKPGTKEKDRVILLRGENIRLEQAKIIWEFEQLVNAFTDTRLHANLEE